MKFYFVELMHKDSNKVFHKFGVTSKKDVLERFNSRYDTRYNDFIIRVLYSAYGTKEDALKLESKMLSLYPKDFILEVFLNVPYNYYSGLKGITEICIIPQDKIISVVQALTEIRNEKYTLDFSLRKTV